MKKEVFKITGMHCASCASIIQKTLEERPEVTSANINIANEKGYVEYDENHFSPAKIIDEITAIGYGAKVLGTEKEDPNAQEKKLRKAKNRFLFSLILTLPLIFLSMGKAIGLPDFGGETMVNLLLQGILATAVLSVNFPILKSGTLALWRRTPNMDSLITLGTLVAFASSAIFLGMIFSGKVIVGHVYFEGVGMILTFIALGKYFETKTKGATSAAVRKLMKLQLRTATLWEKGEEKRIEIENIIPGNFLVIKAGERVPIDGIITEGITSVDESAITGESIPTEKNIGDKVIGGTINQRGRIIIIASCAVGDTLLSQIIKTVEDALSHKAPIQKLVDRVSFYFVPVVMTIAVFSAGIWLLLGASVSFALGILVSVLVIACPCALGLATPTAIMMGTGLAASRGILLKNPEVLEKVKTIDIVVFDKTGTLTEGKPKVVTTHPFGSVESDELISLAFSLARHSHHPLSQAVVNYAADKNFSEIPLHTIEEREGRGVRAFSSKDNSLLLLGNEKLMEEEQRSLSSEHREAIEALAQEGKTPLLFARGENIMGILGIMDTARPEAKASVEALQKSGREVILLTGDKDAVAKTVASSLGISRYIAEVLPQEKHQHIQHLQDKGKRVVMVGDGINDAPALAQADIGIAMGNGTDIALEAGSIVLTNSDIMNIPRALRISALTFSKIRQNLFWAFAYNVLSIPIAAGVLFSFSGFLLSPSVAAAAMAFSSVSVVTNSLLMKYSLD